MLRFRKTSKEDSVEIHDLSVSKLFFDTFSARLGDVEGKIQLLSNDFQKLKLSTDQMQISDLVLLERIQQGEAALKESLESMQKITESMSHLPGGQSKVELPGLVGNIGQPATSSPVVIPRVVGEGILSALGTATELQVISLLNEQGPKTAPEIGRTVGRSREHTARLLKKLYEEGYVRRDQARVPFRYSLVDRVKASLKGSEKTQDAETAPVAAPPA